MLRKSKKAREENKKMEKRKVFKNIELKGIISKKRAIELLGMETEKTTIIKEYKIIINEDGNNNIIINYINEFEEPADGLFE